METIMICTRCAAGDHCGPAGGITPQCTCQHLSSVSPAPVPEDTLRTTGVLDEVLAERQRQTGLWGDQRLPFHHYGDGDGSHLFSDGGSYAKIADRLKYVCDARRAYARSGGEDCRSNALVLLEEVFEALAETEPVKIREELVQVAAVAVKAVEALDRTEAEAHAPRCQRGMYHDGVCGPAAVPREDPCAAVSGPADPPPVSVDVSAPLTSLRDRLAEQIERIKTRGGGRS